MPYRKPSALPSGAENGLQPCLLPEDSDNVSEKGLGLLVRGNSDVRSTGGRASSVLPPTRPQGALDQHLGVGSSSGSRHQNWASAALLYYVPLEVPRIPRLPQLLDLLVNGL